MSDARGQAGGEMAAASAQQAVVLASGSPRRAELLGATSCRFTVRAADIDESVLAGEAADGYVRRLAVQKALAVDAPGALVIAADTTVVLDGEILAKPLDRADAVSMLTRLAGRRHEALTGVCVARDGRVESEVCTTVVHMAAMDAREIEWYVATGEPMDKAGAYGLQGRGGCFVTGVEGNVQNVVGLPMTVVLRLARALGAELLATP